MLARGGREHAREVQLVALTCYRLFRELRSTLKIDDMTTHDLHSFCGKMYMKLCIRDSPMEFLKLVSSKVADIGTATSS